MAYFVPSAAFFSGSGQANLVAKGTNQNVVITPSGTGMVLITNDSSVPVIISRSNATTGSFPSTLIIRNANNTANNTTTLALSTIDNSAAAINGASISAIFTGRGANTVTADIVFSTSNGTPSPSEKGRLSAGGNFSVTGTVLTGAPTVGSAGAWNLGTYTTDSISVQTGVVRINIGGVAYKLLASNT